MTLATVDEEGVPDARMVLLKGFGPDGFRFFTNYESAKGVELAASPRAALVIYWRELDRQVRVRGAVERLPAEDSDAYFASRPRDSRIAAAASPQSRAIERVELDRRYDELDAELGGAEVAPSGLLGRIPPPSRRDRVLAGTGEPDARPLPLHAGGRRRVDDRAARAIDRLLGGQPG